MLARMAGMYNQSSPYPLYMIAFALDAFYHIEYGSGNEDIERQWL